MKDLLKSIVLIQSINQEKNEFGTGFIVYFDNELKKTYIITCFHVVKNIIDSNEIEEHNYIGNVVKVGKEHAHIKKVGKNEDLAVLEINKVIDSKEVLKIAKFQTKEHSFITHGYYKDENEDENMGHFDFRINLQITADDQGHLIDGKRIQKMFLKVKEENDNKKLASGYSGSPLFDNDLQSVVGVLYMSNQDNEGKAVVIDELENVWPEMPEELKKQLNPLEQTVIDGDEEEVDSDFEFAHKNIFAFLVGINDYEIKTEENGIDVSANYNFSKLNYCKEDVVRFVKFLNKHQNDKKVIKKEITEKEETKRANILFELDKFIHLIKENKENPLVLIYFSGHSYLYDEEAYLIPFEGNKENKYSAISYKEIKDLLNKIDSENLIVIIDSCYSGELAENEYKGSENLNSFIDQVSSNKFHVISSCGKDEKSKDGIFTETFFNLLEDSDRFLEEDLYEITTVNLLPELKKRVEEKSNKKQVPSCNFDFINDKGKVIGLNKRKKAITDKKKEVTENLYTEYFDRIKADEIKKRVANIVNETMIRIEEFYDELDMFIRFGDQDLHLVYNKFIIYANAYNPKITNDLIVSQVVKIFMKYLDCFKVANSNQPIQSNISANQIVNHEKQQGGTIDQFDKIINRKII